MPRNRLLRGASVMLLYLNIHTYTHTQFTKGVNLTAMRRLCKVQGEWKVGVNKRPKFPNGGWEVYVKYQGSQKWSKPSNSKDPIGNLKETIAFANTKMIELQKEKEDYKGRDESTEQMPMNKKRRKEEVVDLS